MSLENKKAILSTKEIAIVGIMTATIECSKLALSFIPNIEVVMLLCALYGYVFGLSGIIASIIFVCIEPLIYGFGSWMVTYFLFWPSVALIFMLFARRGIKSRLATTLTATGLSVIFGIISSFIDTAFFLGINENYLKNLIIYYVRGLGFDIVHTVSNLLIFAILFPFLLDKLQKLRKIYNL